MINIETDELLSPEELGKRLPIIAGSQVSGACVRRWIDIGLDGVKLDGVRVGRKVCTTWQSFVEWTALRAELRNGKSAVQTGPSNADLAADRQLQALGV